MRPALLNPLFASPQTLKGVGPRFATFLEKCCGPHVVDLLFHLPFRAIDRRNSPPIMRAHNGEVVTLTVTVQGHKPGKGSQPTRVRVGNESGFFDLVFFRARGDYLEKQLPVDSTVVVSGTFEDYQGKKQMPHPDYIVPLERKAEIPEIQPVYALTAGLPAKTLYKAIQVALERLPEMPEWQDGEFLKQKKWPAFKAALETLHRPTKATDMEASTPARQRLAYDELLGNQLALALMREKQRVLKGRALKPSHIFQKKLLANLPYQLTPAQTTACAEIAEDMQSGNRMLRLLQGDVGSGKTLVALMAMLHAVEAGTQAALMVPTDILAQQHFKNISALAAPLGLDVVLLSGKLSAAVRRGAQEKIADGSAKLIIGTHALFQDDVTFADLGLAVVDEQHRFGVHQRLALQGKGTAPDLLVMTATPIPRTLTLTFYGDMDVSRLLEKPAGRKPIDTRTVALNRLPEVVDAVARKIQTGEKVYWVCPLVEESELIDLAAATERYQALKAYLGEENVRLVHGQMKAPEREAAMQAFAQGNAKVLVATTVIEVGVDVPEATLIVIEHAERFGLAQLHQLRGRVGRSDKDSNCLLLYADPLGEIAQARLKMMRETNDGFRLAEEDLRLRGPGEVLGSRQSGMQEFKLADLSVHGELLLAARDDTKLILSRDPELKSPRGLALRHLLYLFAYDQAIKTLRSG